MECTLVSTERVYKCKPSVQICIFGTRLVLKQSKTLRTGKYEPEVSGYAAENEFKLIRTHQKETDANSEGVPLVKFGTI